MKNYLREQFDSSPRLISVVGRLLTILLQKELNQKSIDISVEEWRILFYLWLKDGITQKSIAEQASKDKTTIARHLNRMERKNLVERKQNPEDGRNRLIYLTDYAKSFEQQTLEIAHMTMAKVEKGISAEDIEITKRVLRQMMENLGKPDNAIS